MEIFDGWAVKYRPRRLGHVRGQQQATEELSCMFRSGNIRRSILISGPTGTGKTSLARVVAAHLNCENPTLVDGSEVGDPCGVCETCEAIQQGRASDVHEIDTAKERGIDDAKRLAQNARYVPRGRFRVFIADECHQYTPDAKKSLLKVLEEPPPGTVFILCTTEPDSLPKEMRNRLLHLKLKPVSVESTVKALRRILKAEKVALDDEVLKKVAAASQGCVRDAVSWLESIAVRKKISEDFDIDDVVAGLTGTDLDDAVTRWLAAVYVGDYTTAYPIVDAVADGQRFLESALAAHELVCRLVLAGQKERYREAFYEAMQPVINLAATKPIGETNGTFLHVSTTLLEGLARLRWNPAPPLRAVLGWVTLGCGLK